MSTNSDSIRPNASNVSITEQSGSGGLYPSNTMANYTLALLFSAYVLSFVDRQVLSLLIGPIRADFAISDFQFSLLHGLAFAIFYTIAGLPLGRLADSKNRRNIICFAIFAWSLMTCICGTAKSFGHLFMARVGVGIGEAGLSPAAYSLLADSYKKEKLGYALAIYKIGIAVGSGLSFLIGGVLYEYFAQMEQISVPLLGELKPWQATFLVIGSPGFLLALLFTTLREPSRKGLLVQRESSAEQGLPIKVVFKFLGERKRVYLYLMLGASMLAIVGYGTASWYPEFLLRTFGMQKSEAGAAFGIIYIVAGTAGIFSGPWLADRLRERGHADANIRVVMLAAIFGIVPATLSPLMPSAELALLFMIPAIFCTSSYMGVMAAGLQIITPNQMRGQVSALYLFATNILGMAIGTSIVAIFTDFVFVSDEKLFASLACLNGLFYPLALLFIGLSLAPYRKALIEADKWLS